MRRKVVLALACVGLLGAAGVILALTLRPEPPPSSAEEVLAALDEANPEAMDDEELDRWVRKVASAIERLPPHEFQRLVTKAVADESLRERFRSLEPEQRRKLMELVSEEQRSRMMVSMATAMVETLKAMPEDLRIATLQQMWERREQMRAEGRRRGGPRPEMTKERFARRIAATTPTQRARLVRAMREMRRMMQQAGIQP